MKSDNLRLVGSFRPRKNRPEMIHIWIDPELESLIPPPADDELDLLRQSIQEHGVREPIRYVNTKVLRDAPDLGEGEHHIVIDGHNRIRIAMEDGWDLDSLLYVPETPRSRDEVIEWMLTNQLSRRNLSTAQKLTLGYRLAEMTRARAEANRLSNLKQNQTDDTESANLHNREPVDTTAAAAKIAGVSRRTASKFRFVQVHAEDDLRDHMESGDVSIDRAYRDARRKAVKEQIERECPEPPRDREVEQLQRQIRSSVKATKQLAHELWQTVRLMEAVGAERIDNLDGMGLRIELDTLRHALRRIAPAVNLNADLSEIEGDADDAEDDDDDGPDITDFETEDDDAGGDS
jgi:hypothetical protein